MENKSKKRLITLGVLTFFMGMLTTLYSFTGSTYEEYGTDGTSGEGCWVTTYSPCPPSTNTKFTVNGSQSTEFTFEEKKGPANTTVGFNIFNKWGINIGNLPLPSTTSTSSSKTIDGITFTLSYEVQSANESFCSSGGSQACARVDCFKNLIQTYQCANPGGTGTGGSGGTSTGTGGSGGW